MSYVTENRYCIDEFVLRLCRRSWVTGSFWFGLIDEVGNRGIRLRAQPNQDACNFSNWNDDALRYSGIFNAFPMHTLNTAFPMQSLSSAVSQIIYLVLACSAVSQ